MLHAGAVLLWGSVRGTVRWDVPQSVGSAARRLSRLFVQAMKCVLAELLLRIVLASCNHFWWRFVFDFVVAHAGRLTEWRFVGAVPWLVLWLSSMIYGSSSSGLQPAMTPPV